MTTANQLLKGMRGKKKHKPKSPILKGNPQKKGVCVRIYDTKPKKPNSAQRSVAKLLMFDRRLYHKQYCTAYIPGQGFNIQQHSVVLIRGGRVKDLPGVHYKVIRGKLDFTGIESFQRRQGRSKYSVKRKLK